MNKTSAPSAGLDSGFTLTEWLESTQEKRDELDAYGKSPLPADAGERHVDIEKAIQGHDDAERLLADAESFLTQETARAVLSVKEDHPKLSADERRALVRDEVRGIQRLVDGIAATKRTLSTRIFAIQNANRAR